MVNKLEIRNTMDGEKFCLRWNDFENNISLAFRELRENKDFFDVTIVCDDEQVQAHKVVLSACSPFFCNILRKNPHQHPLLYLRGIKFSDLLSVLNFIYHGEVNIVQEDLNSFLSVAEDLKVKGLTSQNKSREINVRQTQDSPTSVKPTKSSIPTKHHFITDQTSTPSRKTLAHVDTMEENNVEEIVPIKLEQHEQYKHNESASLMSAMTNQEDNLTYDDFDNYDGQDQIYEGSVFYNAGEYAGGEFQDPSELLQFVQETASSDKKYKCSSCNYAHNVKANVRNHVESVHYPNSFQYPCNQCDKLFPSKNNVQLHRSRIHKQKNKLS